MSRRRKLIFAAAVLLIAVSGSMLLWDYVNQRK